MKPISPLSTLIALTVVMVLGALSGNKADKAGAYLYTTVAVGGQHSCAITGTTGVKCWGRNAEGQIGDGTTTRRVYATDVSGLSSGATALAAGGQHTCAVASGTAKCWGNNLFGEVGDGTNGGIRPTPTNVCASGSGGSCTTLTGATAIAAGSRHTCAVVSGGAKCWGRNNLGQLGDGTRTARTNPVQVAGLTSNVVDVVTGDSSSCALLSAGTVKCWGANGYGQLGDGTNVFRNSPVDVVGLTGVGRLAAGDNHVCAMLSTGGMKCWGSNEVGQVGDTTTANRKTPVTVCAAGTGSTCDGSLASVVGIAAGAAHTCAVTSSPASVYCWGWDGFGQLSDGPGAQGFLDQKYRPTQVAGAVPNSNLGAYPYAVLSIGAGAGHSCAVLDPSGLTYCWGWNVEGQLGDGKTTDRTTWAADTDWDGCTDEREAQTAVGTEASGGRRNAFHIWDFFDTPDTTNTTLTGVVW